MRARLIFSAIGVVLAAPSTAAAADILLVSDSGADLGIATALMADGHTVTTMSDMFAAGSNPALTGDLSDYDAVYWSQDGTGGGDAVTDAALISNLVDYVTSGGRLFVTGYDSVASPSDPMLVTLLGASGSGDVVGAPGPIADVDTSLTVGVVDIRGLTPTGGVGDTDHLTGLGSDTIAVSNSASGGGAQWTIRTLGSGEIAYISNGSSSASWTTVSTDGSGAFNAAIRNFASAADAAATVPGAPEIEFDRVYGAAEGEEVILGVTVTDLEGDAVTYSWDLDADGTFGELPGMASYTLPAGTTDGPSTVALSVQASDGTHTSVRTRTLRIRNVDPLIASSPPINASVGATVRYTVEVDDPGAALDPPTFTLIRGPTSAAFAGGTLVWVPTDTEVTVGEDRIAFEIAVADGDMGTANQAWEMSVSPNRLPSSPALLYPAGGILITDTTPRLAVQDATDADYADTITYFFELDDEETFADPVVARAEMLPEAPGFTTYQLTTPLPPGQYYWRAWAFDGFAESAERLSTTFTVVGDPVVADAGPSDADVRPDAGGPPVTRGGCSASRTTSRSTTGLLFLALALGLLAGRARRSRSPER